LLRLIEPGKRQHAANVALVSGAQGLAVGRGAQVKVAIPETETSLQQERDMVGFALGATHANGRLGDYQRQFNELNPTAQVKVLDGYEYVSELFYNWSPIPSINLRPNLQYILHPGGTRQNSNAFVLGLKTSISF